MPDQITQRQVLDVQLGPGLMAQLLENPNGLSLNSPALQINLVMDEQVRAAFLELLPKLKSARQRKKIRRTSEINGE